VVARATSACIAGECAVATCEAGFLDCNADAIDGCELEDGCAHGGSCTTSCGSTGTGTCTSACMPAPASACMPPTETCTYADDDCDGRVDDLAELASCE